MSITAKPTDAVAAVDPDGNESGQEFDLEDRLVAEQFIHRAHCLLEKNHLFGETKAKPDLQHMRAAAEPEAQDSSKVAERGIRSLTHSVIDEFSRCTSEVSDGPHFDHTEVSSENCFQGSHAPTKEQSHNGMLAADFEGADGDIDSAIGGHPVEPTSNEQKRRISFPNGMVRDGIEEHENEDNGEVFQASQQVTRELQPTEVQSNPLSGEENLLQEEFSQVQNHFEERETDSALSEVIDDAASNLGTISAVSRIQDEEECAQQTRLGSEIVSLRSPRLVDLDVPLNSFSLENRIRKAREQQAISLEWEAALIAENEASFAQVNFEGTSRSILPGPKALSPDVSSGSLQSAVENVFHSPVKETIRTGLVAGELLDDAKESLEKKPGVGDAVLLGALASGVNGPTWFMVKAVLVALVASLVLLLHVAIKSDSSFVLLNVLFLIFIAVGLILLLGWYVSQTGLVSVDKQMEELHLTSELKKWR